MRRPAARWATGLCAAATSVTVISIAAACTTPPAQTLPTSGTTATATGAGTPSPTAARPPLVVETVFDHAGLDPTRQFERSGLMLSKALYQTLTTLDPADPSRPVPGIAEYSMSPEGNWLTIRLRAGLTFSDGTKVTSDDVAFTLARAKGLGGPTAAMIGSLGIVKVDDRTLTLTSPDSNFALPSVLANPALGILNSAAVKAQGGTIGPRDTAGGWLATHSAGSGPYVVVSATPGRSVTLAANPNWNGPTPAFPDVIVRSATPGQQLRDVESGAADIVLDLSPNQANAVRIKPVVSSVSITTMQSSSLAFLLLGRSKTVNQWTGNPNFVQAVRLGLDLPGLAAAAGDAVPSLGLIPEGIDGAFEIAPSSDLPPDLPPDLPSDNATATVPSTVPSTSTPTITPTPTTTPTTPTTTPTAVPVRDVAAARAALARSGYRGQPIPLSYASDLPIQGVPTTTVAAAIKAQLAQVGINVRLAPARAATALDSYRKGTNAMGLWSWSPDYPDPENYLAFAPGGLVGLRAGWPRSIDPAVDDATIAARDAFGDDRAKSFGAWQQIMNERSPFIPLFQPMSHHAHGDRVTTLVTNPVWTLEISAVS